MRICWLEARGYWNVDQVWPRDPQPCYETSCIMQMKGTHAPPPENWDTRQTLLRELVPSQSRSASPLPFLIRTSSFFHLASPQGDRWNLKKKVAFHDPPSSAEKSRMKNQGKKKRERNDFHRWKGWFKSGRQRGFRAFNSSQGRSKKRRKKNLIGSRRSSRSPPFDHLV